MSKLKLALTLALITSCTTIDYEYSRHHAYLIFDNNANRSVPLSAAMNAMAPGIFCRISQQQENVYRMENNQNQQADAAWTEKDRRISCQLGTYKQTGIIVGFGNLDNPPVFFCYDAQCPNCYEASGMPRYLLTMDTQGHATCKSCHRTYDLNNYGLVISGTAGDKLIRYRAQTTGPMGVLTVNN